MPVVLKRGVSQQQEKENQAQVRQIVEDILSAVEEHADLRVKRCG